MRTQKPSYYLAKTIAFAKTEGGIKELDLVLRLDISASTYEKLKALFKTHDHLIFDNTEKRWLWRNNV